MGVVYISRQRDEDRFTVGAAKSLAQRKSGGYTRYNPGLKLYHLMRTPDHFALERFLHDELAGKRDRNVQSESWYLATSGEIDLAIHRAETLGKEYIECKKRVAAVKASETDGSWLQPDERLKAIHARLSRLSIEKSALCHEEQILRTEAMAQIGKADGVEGLFEWPSHEVRRFQTKVFASRHPDLYDEFRKLSFVRKFKLWGRQEDEGCEDITEQD